MQEEREPWKIEFYNSTAWRNTSRGYAAWRCHICEMCGNKNVDPNARPYYRQFIVHHRIPLTAENVNDPEISLNWENLELLCRHCHNLTHYSPQPFREGLEFDENGQPREIKHGRKETDAPAAAGGEEIQTQRNNR